ncbi:MAG: GNAT family N-acetyltransferase [Alteromonadales bacterium]|nr:GNAT family N-acetyltransferase [Alteromonadales bacterium]
MIGCIALKPANNGYYEISKMAVDKQGQGIGRLLLLKALDKARELGVKTVCLESNTKLKRALTLYQNFGFTELPHPNGKSDYPRADIYMELALYV